MPLKVRTVNSCDVCNFSRLLAPPTILAASSLTFMSGVFVWTMHGMSAKWLFISMAEKANDSEEWR